MNLDQSIKKLQSESTTHAGLSDVMHVLAVRQRARQILTAKALTKRMHREGFTGWSEKDIGGVLKLLATLGFGTLDLDPKGRVRALKAIKVSLQSLGAAVLGEDSLKLFRQRQRFQSVAAVQKADLKQHMAQKGPMPQVTPIAPVPFVERRKIPQTPVPNMVLTVMVNNKPVNVPVPKDLNPNDIAKLIAMFKDKE